MSSPKTNPMTSEEEHFLASIVVYDELLEEHLQTSSPRLAIVSKAVINGLTGRFVDLQLTNVTVKQQLVQVLAKAVKLYATRQGRAMLSTTQSNHLGNALSSKYGLTADDFAFDFGILEALGSLKGHLIKFWKPLGLSQANPQAGNLIDSVEDCIHSLRHLRNVSSRVRLAEKDTCYRNDPRADDSKLGQAVNDGIVNLHERLRQTAEDAKAKKVVQGKIQGLLHEKWPDKFVYMFGSSANELGFASADIDLIISSNKFTPSMTASIGCEDVSMGPALPANDDSAVEKVGQEDGREQGVESTEDAAQPKDQLARELEDQPSGQPMDQQPLEQPNPQPVASITPPLDQPKSTILPVETSSPMRLSDREQPDSPARDEQDDAQKPAGEEVEDPMEVQDTSPLADGEDVTDKDQGASDKAQGASDKAQGASDKAQGANDKAQGPTDKDQDANDKDQDTNDKDQVTNDKELSPSAILLRIFSEEIAKQPEFGDMECVLSARVPIIKMVHMPSSLQCDICADNTLAVYNTILLKTYADIDWRVRPLIYAVKLWTKKRKVNDSRHGSLSSYAWVLLVIYYLQVLRVPVLPCLQDSSMMGGRDWIVAKVDQYNVSFCASVEHAKKVLKKKNRNRANKDSLGSLLRGFFLFYAHEFNVKQNIVCVRTGKPTPRKKVQGMKWRIMIEDPFELEHDLGSKINGQDAMVRIHTELRMACNLLYDPPHQCKDWSSLEALLFTEAESMEFTRCCFCCGCPGHRTKDCKMDRSRSRVKCFGCNGYGHVRKECPKRQKKNGGDLRKNGSGDSRRNGGDSRRNGGDSRKNGGDPHKQAGDGGAAPFTRAKRDGKRGKQQSTVGGDKRAAQRQKESPSENQKQQHSGNRQDAPQQQNDRKQTASKKHTQERSPREANKQRGARDANRRGVSEQQVMEDNAGEGPPRQGRRRRQNGNKTTAGDTRIVHVSQAPTKEPSSKPRRKKQPRSRTCVAWSTKGSCKFGDACKYAHIEVVSHPPGF